MSHGVHAVQHEVEHEIKHGDGGHGGPMSLLDNLNKKVALLIGVIALLLAFSETLGKSDQNKCTACGTKSPIAMNTRPMPPSPRAIHVSASIPVMTVAEAKTIPIWNAAEATS